MAKNFNYNDDLEKILTAIFGAVGMIAIFINLHLKGYGNENWLDAIKDIAGLIVAIAVFLVANKVLRLNNPDYSMPPFRSKVGHPFRTKVGHPFRSKVGHFWH